MADGAKRGRIFTQEEANAILAHAAERQHARSGDLSYDDLVDIARQAGISTDAIEAAVRDARSRPTAGAVLAEPSDADVRMELAARTWSSRRAFVRHFSAFVMVSVLLGFINLQTMRHDPDRFLWSLIVVLGWGIAIAVHFTSLLYGSVFPDPRAAERAREDLRRRGEKQLRRTGGVRVEPGVRVAEVEADALEETDEEPSKRASRR